MTNIIVNQNEIHKAIWDWLFEGNNGISELSFISAQYDEDGTIISDSRLIYTPETIGESEETEDIRGNKSCVYTFFIKQYAPLTTQSNTPANIVVLGVFENVINWVKKQWDLGDYPKFPDNTSIDKIELNPGTVAGVDATGAEFMMSIQITYKEINN